MNEYSFIMLFRFFHEIFVFFRIFHASDAFICKALRDEAVVSLPRVPDNEANGRIRQHPKGENISAKKSRCQIVIWKSLLLYELN